ncbi:DUF6443 domain-containing protein [Flavobacterium amniphilum]|uniref:DUF6443 domain-containing protein n=1 Tax=Flavobacterium amniphilum TaxID=1834035 RepID=UPI00202A7A8F|nr:DUF6443 domain-containing protein [Flavobacterium amniphilum]MCL9806925.1 DUF6443 domain-containing protein [Flavobacterium amniphilum]
MKKLILLLLVPGFALAQSTNQNYTKATTYRGPDNTLPQTTVTYFDGLGRPIQKVDNAMSNTGQNIVTHIEYDAYGRPVKDYLPFVSGVSTLDYLSSALTTQSDYYKTLANGDTTKVAYSEKLLEASPLDRVLKQSAPGEAWKMGSGHEIKFEYGTNEANGNNAVKLFKATASWNSSLLAYTNTLTQTENYAANTLYLSITKDENWVSGNNHTTQEFKDKAGKVVLKRTFNNNVAHETYYVYDQFGNLAYVIPPLANAAYDSTTLNGLCYQYQYDNRNRLVSKKLPGKQWEFIVYDLQDRPIATGPALSPWGTGTSGSMVTQYDVYGRPTQTGWIELPMDMNSRYDYQTDMNNGDNVFTLTTNRILSKNYYDNYSYAGAPTPPGQIEGQDVETAVKGMPTGSWVRILTIPTETLGELSYTLYDKKGRPIRTHTDNYLGGYTEVDSKLDFIGKNLYTITRHKRKASDTEIVTTDTFTYTDQDRLKLHTHQIDGGDVQLLADNSYDKLGQLVGKKVGGSATSYTSLQKVDYQYNIRGWLKSINDTDGLISNDLGTKDDLFSFKISYNDPTDNTKALFNGNISETYWRTYNDDQLRKYVYSYDHLNRLLQADYSRPGNVNILNSYKEHLNYDKNGNILSLNRNSFEEEGYEYEIDNLIYTYDSNNKNRLSKVTDSSGWSEGFNESMDTDSDGVNDAVDYTYDANGNMIKDQNKGISKITYNHLNLPVRIEFSTFKNPSIDYVYDSTGRKVNKKVSHHKFVPVACSGSGGGLGQVCADLVATVDKTDYLLGGFQYLNNVLELVPHTEGYVKKEGGNYVYHYNYIDHLGDVRVTYAGDASGTPYIVEENNYYPLGLKHDGYNYTENTSYKYKYNGKELQDELGLNMYDYGARNYDSAIGRWMNIDPKAENSRRWTPYNYAYNNPMYFVDPDGMQADGWITQVIDGEKKISYNSSIDTEEQAKAAGYEGVTAVNASLNISATDGSYSYNLNANGSVTDGQGNTLYATTLMSFTTGAGTKISSLSLIKPFERASGAANDMNFTSPFFSWGWAFKGLGYAWNGLFGTAAKTSVEASGSVYSVAYETTLSSELFPGGSYYSHFKAANTSLSDAMASDVAFSNSMSNLGVTVPRSATGNILGKSPTNWVWHHDVGAGVMQLVPKTQHTTGSIYWETLHPGGVGGMHIWNK